MSKLNKKFDSITPPGHLEQRVKDAVDEAVNGGAFSKLIKQTEETAVKPRKNWFNWRRIAALATALVIFASAVLVGVLYNFGGSGEQPWQVLQRPWQSLDNPASQPLPFAAEAEIKSYVTEFNQKANEYLEYNENNQALPNIKDFVTKNSAASGDGDGKPDIMQTDGENIYIVSFNNLTVLSAADLRIKADIKYDKFFPDSMFLLKNENRLVVLGGEYDREADYYKSGVYPTEEDAEKYSVDYWRANTAAVRIYDTDALLKGEQALLRELKFKNAYYNSARMTGGKLYLSLSAYGCFQGGNVWIPEFYDSLTGTSEKLAPQNIYAAPDNGLFINYSLLAAVDALKTETAALNAYLGSPGTVYTAENGFYLTFPAYSVVSRLNQSGREYYDCEQSGTGMLRFAKNDTALDYKGYNIVQGQIINQASMSELKYTSGEIYFRIATTLKDGEASRITVFDAAMKEKGRLENLSEKNERIYSVSFDGEKAMAVTYKQADPVYIIDLSAPSLPEIESVVKIPLAGDYLKTLSIKDGYIFAAGRRQDKNGNWINGLKISLVDTIGAAAREAASFETSKEYAYSDAAYTHKDMTHFVSADYEAFAFAANTVSEIYETDRYYWLPDYNLCYYMVDKDGNTTDKILPYKTTTVSYENKAEYYAGGYYYADRLRGSAVMGGYIYLIGSHTVQRYNITSFDGWQSEYIWAN